jgi:hypothetical protein
MIFSLSRRGLTYPTKASRVFHTWRALGLYGALLLCTVFQILFYVILYAQGADSRVERER